MTFGQRLVGVLMLDAPTYEEIEADRSATGQAMTVVVAGSIAAGVGAGLARGAVGLVQETLGSLVGWVMWAGATYVIGARLLPSPNTRTDMGELLRVIGFAFAPVGFAFLHVVPVAPVLHWLIRLVVELWLLATMVIAVRQALDYDSTGRAVVVVLAGLFLFEVIQGLT